MVKTIIQVYSELHRMMTRYEKSMGYKRIAYSVKPYAGTVLGIAAYVTKSGDLIELKVERTYKMKEENTDDK